ncbi:MAG: hypothetical protein AAFQ35_09235 [Pseudomonadota bacterium]
MLRTASFLVLGSSVWLAYSALPDSQTYRSFDPTLALGSAILEQTPAPSTPHTTIAGRDLTESWQVGRTAADVFGANGPTASPRRSPEGAAHATVIQSPEAATHVTGLAELRTRRKALENAAPPLPVRTPTTRRYAEASRAYHAQTSARVTVTPGSDTPQPTLASLPSAPGADALRQLAPDTVVQAQPRHRLPRATATAEAAPRERQMSRAEARRIAQLLQRELYRVGCYRGARDGRWGSGSRFAMQRFAERIGAGDLAPIPDYVNLMLVETFDGRACAKQGGATVVAASAPATSDIAAGATNVTASPTATDRQTNQIKQVAAVPVPARNRYPRQSARRVASAKPAANAADVEADTSTDAARAATRASRVATARTPAPATASTTGNTATSPQQTASTEAPSTQSADARQTRTASAQRARRLERQRRARRVAQARRRYIRTVRRREAERRAQRRRVAARRARQSRRASGFRGTRRNWVRRAFVPRN